MGAPVTDMNAADEMSAEALLTSLRTIDPAERRRHASVLNYWLSIRGTRQFPAIRDLDPLEISDAGPCSVLMEMIGGGEDAEIRHLGHAIKAGVDASRISDAPAPSLLACIHAKLPIVAASRQVFAFEDEFDAGCGRRRCWVTLLPLSASGTWIDFVYAFVSLDGAAGEAAEAATGEPDDAGGVPEPFTVELRPYDETDSIDPAPEPEQEPGPEPAADLIEVDEAVESESAPEIELEPEPVAELESELEPPAKAGFSTKLFEGLASVGGFYGKVAHAIPAMPAVPQKSAAHVEAIMPGHEAAFHDETADRPADEPDHQPDQPAPPPVLAMEGSLQDKLSAVRGMAENARQAQERSNLALYEGLGAAYDFALDAEDEPENYLRLVEAQGLKIQLRSPMKPVVKLVFAGLTDDDTIGQLEAVLAWALEMELPRGSLAERIQAEGGIGRILAGKSN